MPHAYTHRVQAMRPKMHTPLEEEEEEFFSTNRNITKYMK